VMIASCSVVIPVTLHRGLAVRRGAPGGAPTSAAGATQRPDEHRPAGPVLLPVEHQLSEGAALRVAPELADPVGPLEVGEHQDVKELGSGSGTEGVETVSERRDR